jgi:Zn-dependent protease
MSYYKTYIIKIIFHALLIASSILIAGTTGKISGTVVDAQTGAPLIGCNVILDGTNLGAATNLDGGYYILNISPGTYSLRASMIGYGSVR